MDNSWQPDFACAANLPALASAELKSARSNHIKSKELQESSFIDNKAIPLTLGIDNHFANGTCHWAAWVPWGKDDVSFSLQEDWESLTVTDP